MKTISLFLILLSSVLYKITSPTTVYLCDSPNAKKYHYKSDCRGLSNCSYKIVKSTLEKAIKEKKTKCGWEK